MANEDERMSFTITGGVTEVWQCTECGWCQSKKHFPTGEDGIECHLCHSSAEKIEEIEPTQGMSDFKYRELLTTLEEETSGVGAATVENIRQHFEEGNEFRDAAKSAHQKMETDSLEAVSGVGQSSAKAIALTIADEEGWENGAIFEF